MRRGKSKAGRKERRKRDNTLGKDEWHKKVKGKMKDKEKYDRQMHIEMVKKKSGKRSERP